MQVPSTATQRVLSLVVDVVAHYFAVDSDVPEEAVLALLAVLVDPSATSSAIARELLRKATLHLQLPVGRAVVRALRATPALSEQQSAPAKKRPKKTKAKVVGDYSSSVGDEATVIAHAHAVVLELSVVDPRLLLNVMPMLNEELLADDVERRMATVHVLGRLFARPSGSIAHDYRRVLLAFLERTSGPCATLRCLACSCP